MIMKVLLARDSTIVRQMISRDVERSSVDSFFRSIGDLGSVDLSEDLITLSMPVLGVYGTNDNIVSPKNAELLAKKSRTTKIVMIPNSRHFPMVDEPKAFVHEIRHFLDEETQL
jgi:pimeloyl-ACP methyl ester carboxylesterase